MEDSTEKAKLKTKSTWVSFTTYELAFLKLLKEISRSHASNSLQRLELLSEIIFSIQLASVILFFKVDIDGYENFKDLVSFIFIIRLDYLAIHKVLSHYNVKNDDFEGLGNIFHGLGIWIMLGISMVSQLRALSTKIITKRFGSRSNLMMDRKEEIGVYIHLFLCVFLRRSKFTYILAGSVAFYMLRNFYICLPSHSDTENFLKISRNLLIILLCVSYYVGFLATEPALMFLNTIFVFPILMVTAKHLVNARTRKLREQISLDPVDLELCLRNNEKLKEIGCFQDYLQRMAFELGDDLQLGLFESKCLYELYKKNEVALLKLSKILYFTNLKERNFLSQLEIKYGIYCYFDYLISKTKLTDPGLVKLGMKCNKIKEKDLQVCQQTIRYLEQISLKNQLSEFDLFKISQELMESIKSVKNQYKTLIRRYPGEEEFTDLYIGLQDIYDRINPVATINKTRLKSNTLRSFQKVKNQEDPRIVVYGEPKKLGNIIYMSFRARKVLKYQTECKHIKNIVPAIHKASINDFLKNLFFKSDYTTHRYPYFCLQKKDGTIVLVRLYISVTWYKLNPFFIISFRKHSKHVNSYIIDAFGSILACSKTASIDTGDTNNVNNLGLEIMNEYEPSYIEKEDDTLGCIRFRLPIYQEEIYIVLLFRESNFLEELTDNFEQIKSEFNRKYNKCLEILSCFFAKSKLKSPHMHKSLEMMDYMAADEMNTEKLTISSAVKKRGENMAIIKNAISLYTRPIRIGTKIVMVVYICSSLIVIFLTYFGILEIVSNIAIDELGSMRSLTQSISSSTKAIQLLNSGYEMEYTEEHYKLDIETSSKRLKDLVISFQDGVTIDLLLTKPLFTQNTVHVYDMIHNEITEADAYLSESLRLLSDKALALSSKETREIPDYFYILQNGPMEILKTLNMTVYEALELTLDRIDLLEILYSVLCALIFVPSFIFLVVAALAIKYLERIHSQFLKSYAKLRGYTICEIGNIIQERILMEFDVEDKGEYGSKAQTRSISMWTLWRYTIGLIILASGVSYLMITFIYPNQIFLIIKQQPNHDFWYGFSRLIPTKSYYWTRETYLYYEDLNSYNNLFPNYSLIPDILGKNIEVAEEYNFVIQNLRFILRDTYTGTIDNYNKIMYGRACEVLGNVIPSCEKTLVARGISLGVIEFINIVKGVGYMAQRGETKWEEIKKLEQKSEYLKSAATELMTIVTNSSEDILTALIIKQIILSVIMFAILGIFIVFMINRGLLKIASQFVAKVRIIAVIDESVVKNFAKSLTKKD